MEGFQGRGALFLLIQNRFANQCKSKRPIKPKTHISGLKENIFLNFSFTLINQFYMQKPRFYSGLYALVTIQIKNYLWYIVTPSLHPSESQPLAFMLSAIIWAVAWGFADSTTPPPKGNLTGCSVTVTEPVFPLLS